MQNHAESSRNCYQKLSFESETCRIEPKVGNMGPARALEESVGPARALEEREKFRKNASHFFKRILCDKNMFLASRQYFLIV